MFGKALDTSRLVVFGDSLSDNGNLFALIGQPVPPYWEGHFSNGPTYIEQLATWLGVPLEDHAFGGAKANDASPGGLFNPATGEPLPINLSEQVAAYVAQLQGHPAPEHTTAVINIGSNDYLNYLASDLPKDPQTIVQFAASVVTSIGQAIDVLSQAGIDNIVLFTLPDFGVTPELTALGPVAVQLGHELAVVNNAALQQLAANHDNIRVVDAFQLSEAVLKADPHSFGLTDVTIPLINFLPAGSTDFAPNEVAFFDGIHPTYATHGIEAAFTQAILTSDHFQFLDGTQDVVHARDGSNFIFAVPIDAANPSLNDDYTIYGGSGSNLIFAGSGNVTVHGGSGNELIAAGCGNATLDGGRGSDVLATNSTGSNVLDGGRGDDALVANRGGTDTLRGGSGNDLIVLKENASAANPDGTFDFGAQKIAGGEGRDTLRLIVNDQNPAAEKAFIAEFMKIEAAFDFASAHHHGSFQIDGLDVSGIERIELQVDSVSKDPNTPYLITHEVMFADGHGGHVDHTLNNLMHTAEHWGLLTV